MKSKEYIPPFAVITGASRGIGAEYARALAAQGYDLLLVARDQARLKELAIELEKKYHIQIDTEIIDLAQPDTAHHLYAAAQRRCNAVKLLINNAGFGMFGHFVTMPIPHIQEMLQLHVNTIVESTRIFLPSMMERQAGAIINVASVAGFFPIPYIAEYAATKAFLISFSEALAEEVRESGVQIQACCPGYTKTDFHKTAGYSPRNPLRAQSAKEVVRASLEGLEKGRTRVTIGWQGRLSDFISRYAPRSILIRIAGNQTKPSTVK